MRTYRSLLWILSLSCLGNLATAVAQTTGQRGVRVDSTSKPSTPDLSGHYWALVIGEVHYKELPPLRTAGSDATEIAKVLQENYGFKTKLLLDATRDEILGALDDYRSSLQPDDNLLIAYSGHGLRDPQSDEAYWVPVDGQAHKTARWINATEITGETRAIAARHVLIISDSCYSGTLADERTFNSTVNDPHLRQLVLQKALEGKSRHLMSSGGDEPVSDDSAPGESSDHSVFANALLQGLREIVPNEFTGMELFYQWVHDPVAGQSKQQPEYDLIRDSGHNSGDFVFSRLMAPPPAPPPPFNFKKVFNQALVLEHHTRWADAAALLQKAEPQAKGKNLNDVMEHEAADFQNAKMYDQAAQQYQKLIAASPGNASYHSALATTYVSAGKMPDAEAECAKAGQSSPPDGTRCYLNLGAISNNSGKLDDAARAFRKAAQLDPKNAEASFEEGQALMGEATKGPGNNPVAPPGTVEALQTYLRLQPHGTHAKAAQAMLNSIQPPVQRTAPSALAESTGGGAGNRTVQASLNPAPKQAPQAKDLQDSSVAKPIQEPLPTSPPPSREVPGVGVPTVPAPKHLTKTFHLTHQHTMGSCEGDLTIGNGMIKYQASQQGGHSFEFPLEGVTYGSSKIGGGFYVRVRGGKLWELHADSLEDLREIFEILEHPADYK